MKILSEQYLHNHWAKEDRIKLRSKSYRVGKMSYGDYFLEPVNWPQGENYGHSPDTLWPEKVIINNQVNYKV